MESDHPATHYQSPDVKLLPKCLYAVNLKTKEDGKTKNHTITFDKKDQAFALAVRCHKDKLGEAKLMVSHCHWVELDYADLGKGDQKQLSFIKGE